MTVCVVARCTENNSFVLAGDRLFSYGNQYSYDSISLKRIGLTPDSRWHTMFAASPVSNVLPTIRSARRILNGGGTRPPYGLDTVERACVQAYQEQRRRLVNDTILSKYGIDLETYRRDGLNFGVQECARINSEIDQLRVGVELIVFGYDEWNVAHLLKVQGPGASMCCDQDGIAVAGSGAPLAHSSLLSDPLPVASQAEMICRLCEAKFSAEQDRYVGKDTAAGVFNHPASVTEGTSERFISIPAMSAIRQANSLGQNRPYPRALLDGIMNELKSAITSENIGEAIRLAKRIIDRRRRNRESAVRPPRGEGPPKEGQ
jgi:hypothetical protein